MRDVILIGVHLHLILQVLYGFSYGTSIFKLSNKSYSCYIINCNLNRNNRCLTIQATKNTGTTGDDALGEKNIKSAPKKANIRKISAKSSAKHQNSNNKVHSSSGDNVNFDDKSFIGPVIIDKRKELSDRKNIVTSDNKDHNDRKNNTAPASHDATVYVPEIPKERYTISEPNKIVQEIPKPEIKNPVPNEPAMSIKIAEEKEPSPKTTNVHKHDEQPQKSDIYTLLQKLISQTTPILNDHRILDDINTYMPLLHWNLWQSNTGERRRCNWSNDHFNRYLALLDKLSNIIDTKYENSKNILDYVTNAGKNNNIIQTKKSKEMDQNHTYCILKNNLENYVNDLQRDRMDRYSVIKKFISQKFLEFIQQPYIVYLSSLFYKPVKFVCNLFGTELKLKRPDPHVTLTLDNIFKYYGVFSKAVKRIKSKGTVDRNLLYNNLHSGSWSITFIGTGSRQPTRTRLTSSMLFRKKDVTSSMWLFDCGEGVKIAMEEMELDPKHVDRIFLTHLHGDHCFGLFSFIYQRERPTPTVVYGPPGTKDLINQMHNSTSQGPLNCSVYELVDSNAESEDENIIKPNELGCYKVFEDDSCIVMAAPLKHTMPTVGYVIQEKVTANEKGIKIAICQDSSNSEKMIPIAKEADLLIHEATSSAPTSRVTNIIIKLVELYKDSLFRQGLLEELNEFFNNFEIKCSCFGNTRMSLVFNVKKDTSNLKTKLAKMGDFISTIKPFTGDVSHQQEASHYRQLKDNWFNSIKSLVDRLKALKIMNKLNDEAERLKAKDRLLGKLNSNIHKFNDTQDIDRYITENALKILSKYAITDVESKVLTNPTDNGKECKSSTVSEFIEDISREILEYWQDNYTQLMPIKSNSPHFWTDVHNKIFECFGHSTANMAGKFAATINAKKLLLTHFSNKYSGDSELSNVLTMVRVEHDARKSIDEHNKNSKHKKNIAVISAWDRLIVRV